MGIGKVWPCHDYLHHNANILRCFVYLMIFCTVYIVASETDILDRELESLAFFFLTFLTEDLVTSTSSKEISLKLLHVL